MNCLECGGETAVIDSRRGDGGIMSRRRKCVKCGYRFTTVETVLEREPPKPKEIPPPKPPKQVKPKPIPKPSKPKERYYDDFEEDDYNVDYWVQVERDSEWDSR